MRILMWWLQRCNCSLSIMRWMYLTMRWPWKLQCWFLHQYQGWLRLSVGIIRKQWVMWSSAKTSTIQMRLYRINSAWRNVVLQGLKPLSSTIMCRLLILWLGDLVVSFIIWKLYICLKLNDFVGGSKGSKGGEIFLFQLDFILFALFVLALTFLLGRLGSKAKDIGVHIISKSHLIHIFTLTVELIISGL